MPPKSKKNHKWITAELCDIIEKFVVADITEETSTYYRRKFGHGSSKKQESLDRFAQLLKTPGLDVDVSTSENNSLLAHVVMFIGRAGHIHNVNVHNICKLPLTLSLIEILVNHPSVDVNDLVNMEDGSSDGDESIATAIFDCCESTMDELPLHPAWEALFSKLIFNEDLYYMVMSSVMRLANTSTIKTIVKNPEFDVTYARWGKQTLLTLAIYSKRYDAVTEMFKLPDCEPNRLSVEPSEIDWPADRESFQHPVMHAAEGLRKALITRSGHRMVHILLEHKETDISRVQVYTIGRRCVQTHSLKLMLDHDTFDIHNLNLFDPDDDLVDE